VIHTAAIQGRDGAPLVLVEILLRFSWLRHIFADGGYAGDKLKDALRRTGTWTIAIVKRSDVASGFEVPPHRWVEHTLAWLNRNRRLERTGIGSGAFYERKVGEALVGWISSGSHPVEPILTCFLDQTVSARGLLRMAAIDIAVEILGSQADEALPVRQENAGEGFGVEPGASRHDMID
jgi:transposase